MDLDNGINTTRNALITSILEPTVSAFMKEEIKNTLVCDLNLLESDQNILKKWVKFPFIFGKKYNNTSDHPVIAGARNLIRKTLEMEFDPNKTRLSILSIGASSYELNYIKPRSNVHHLIGTMEGKDTTRTITKMVDSILMDLEKNMSRTQKDKLKAYENDWETKDGKDWTKSNSTIVKNYFSFKSLLTDYKLQKHGKSINVHLELPKTQDNRFKNFNVLLFYDSIYNLSGDDLMRLFSRTNADVAYGYAMMPFEMIFPDMPNNKVYTVEKQAGMTTLYYRSGYSNSYTHLTSTWETLMKELVIIRPGYNFHLEIEFKCRIGPMASFSITRSSSTSPVVRNLELPEEYQYVQVLDIFGSVDSNGNIDKTKLKYFSVVWEEFYFCQEFAMTVKEKDFNTSTFATLLRKVRKGVNLADQTLVSEWNLNDRDCFKLCLAVLADTNITKKKEEKVKKATNNFTKTKSYLTVIKDMIAKGLVVLVTGGLAIPLYIIIKWLTDSDLEGYLIKFPENYKKQKVFPKGVFKAIHDLNYSSGSDPKDFKPITVYPVVDSQPDLKDCPVCNMSHGKLGKQVLDCKNIKDSYYTFEMTRNEVAALRAKLKSSIEGKPTSPLTNSINDFAEALKIKDIKKTVRVEKLIGSPGVGKSVMLRAIANEDLDLILSPYRKLQKDYVKVFDELQNKEMNFNFKTMHKAMSAVCFEKVFVEEFSSFPLELLIPIIDKVDCDILYLVGDEFQTKVSTREGGYIGDTVPLENFSTHVLKHNFRLSSEIMAILNRNFPYGSNTLSKVDRSIVIHDISELESGSWDFDIMNFANFTAETRDLDSNTVRSNQGGSVKKMGLIVSETDHELVNNEGLFCVSISRASQELHLFLSESTPVDNFMRKCFFEKREGKWVHTQEFLENYKNWAKPTIRVSLDDNNSNPEVSKTFFEARPETNVHGTFIDEENLEASTLSRDDNNSDYEESQPLRFTPKLEDFVQMSGISGDLEIIDETIELREENLNKEIMCRQARELNMTLMNRLNEQKQLVANLLNKDNLRTIILKNGNEIFMVEVNDKSKFRDVSVQLAEQMNTLHNLDRSLTKFKPEEFYFFNKQTGITYYQHSVVPLNIKVFQIQINLKAGSKTIKNYDYAYTVKDVPKCRIDEFGDEARTIMERFNTVIPIESTVVYEKPEVQEYTMTKIPSGYDSFLMIDNFLPTYAAKYFKSRLNDVAASMIKNIPTNGKLSIDIYSPVNARGNLVDDFTKKYRMTAGEGLVYLGGDQFQTLQCAAYRYLRKKRNYKMDNTAKALAYDIASTYFEEVVDKNKLRRNFDHYELFNKANHYINACFSRNYEKRMLAEGEFSQKDVRFHLKDIFKPSKSSKVDEMKVGQGISAWSPEANIMFGSAIRLLNHCMATSFKDNVIYNNMISESELNDKVNKQLKLQPLSSVAGVTDGAEFDSMQNEFTQEVEKVFFHKMGFNKNFIDLYYKFRKNYKIISKNFSARCKTEKTSGEPGTLPFNSILSGAFTNYILRGVGRYVMIKQGDDTTKHQSCLKLDKKRLDMIQTYTNFNLKVSIGNTIEFCGKVMGKTAMVPAIWRKIKKIAGHSFRDYAHFTEYQISLRDFMDQLSKIPLNEVLAVNAQCSNTSPENVLSMLSIIESYSHINEEQFREVFKETIMEHRITGKRQQTHC